MCVCICVFDVKHTLHIYPNREKLSTFLLSSMSSSEKIKSFQTPFEYNTTKKN